ncbi:MAG: metal ABC transporter ATP-binding protein [Candidatus Sungiibacteriota bacterium]|uniref:Metal ABC transporter ATP-binding protein n=1 Tax=Candidatus Sungiibacteriota bacterium TaxID=2750080 RepID=A0A7T5RIY1_9BACT|nr:MAG: metal ABC transporter ATP-binding protein [Candidatus Sungbacteria bacterium]
MGGTILEVKNLSVTLDSEEILRDISFSVKKGEALAIIGPNGAGKTVLFRALLGLVPYKGEIRWQNNIQIGYVPQKFFIDRSTPLTVREFFLLKCSNFWFPPKNFKKHLGHELTLVGLPEVILKKPISELSGGQVQRVLISWAMLNHPDVLLFDEPTSGIDVGAEETIYNLIHRLQDERGTTVLLISHDLGVVYRYAGSVLCINKQLVCYGNPQEVLSPQELTKLYGEGRFYHHLENRT